VGFDFGHVVGDIVDLKEMVVFDPAGQNLLEAAPDVKRQHLPVGEGVVGCGLHGCQVIPALGAAGRGAHQFAVGQRQAVFSHGLLEEVDVVGANLVAEPARAAVNLGDDLAGKKPEASGGVLILDAVNHIDLDEVVARAEGAHLAPAPVPGAARPCRRRPRQAAAFLGGRGPLDGENPLEPSAPFCMTSSNSPGLSFTGPPWPTPLGQLA
jgi:hypothetical protein